MISLHHFCAGLALLTAFPSAHAAGLASYEFTGGVLTSSDADAGSSASSVTGTPAPGTAVTNRLTYAAANAPTDWATGTGYASFTVTATGGALSLASLTFDYGFQNVTTGGAYTLRVFTSLTGLASTSDALFTYTLPDAGLTSNITPTNRSVDLSSYAALQNLADGTPVEFRFYFTDGHTGTTRYHLVDNIVVSSIPEPSHGILAAFGIGLMTLRRRRKN